MKVESYKDINKALIRELINDLSAVGFFKGQSMFKTIFELIKNIIKQSKAKSYKLVIAYRCQTTIIAIDNEFLAHLFELLFKREYDLAMYNKVMGLMKSHNIEPYNSESTNRTKGYRFCIDNNVMDELLSLLNSHQKSHCLLLLNRM